MALIACPECKTEISSTARSCPSCGARPQKTKWWLWAPLGAVGLLFVWGMATGPKDTRELAQMETEACIRNKGGGDWRGSSGLTLEEFCKAKGTLIGLKRACEINPSQC